MTRRPRDRALYVETLIRADIERIWDLTQDPRLHARWDARFCRITPTQVRANGAQEFRYERAMGLVTIRGTGVSLGERRSPRGDRTSALRFAPLSILSPLGAGRGYWRYVSTPDGVRFFTGYDYDPAWGPLGRLLDRLGMRRLMWWLTAWSFDRLRLWAEAGIEPERFPLWSVLLPRRGPRPRARRCVSRPAQTSGRARGERGSAMDDAPETLEALDQ